MCLYIFQKLTGFTRESLNLAQASPEELAKLIASCDAAPFGRGTESVLDDSYRKALKLNLSQFGMPFELAATNIIAKIRQELVESTTLLHRTIRAEPYKLNIYGAYILFQPYQST